MVAKLAVTIGWRVLWLVTPVAMRIDEVTAPATPLIVAISLMLKRSLRNTVPRPSASPSRHSAIRSAGERGAPARP